MNGDEPIRSLNESRLLSRSARALIIRFPMNIRPIRNKTPVHEPTLVAALVADDDGNVRRSLGGDIKARRVQRSIAVKTPANSYVTKLERSGEATTHNQAPIAATLALKYFSLHIEMTLI